MLIPRIRTLLLFALICVASCSAATFSYSVNCPAVSIGPDTIFAVNGGIFSGAITLTPNVLDTADFIIPTNQVNTLVRNNSTATFTGTLSCTLIFGGVTQNFTRAITLQINVPGSGALQESHFFTFSAVAFTLNLGAQGMVDVSAPSITTTGGFLSADGSSKFYLIPGSTGETILLHDVPASPPATPAPPSLILVLTGLAGAGLFMARRKFRQLGA
jgi:hypothetical protein